jgi:hypothetical protein
LFKKIDKVAVQSKKLSDTGMQLQQYKEFVESKNYSKLLNRKIESINDLVTAMCIAYSWMPTMLEIHGDEIDIQSIVEKIVHLRSMEWYGDEEIELIYRLSKVTNNSIVGAIKTLHLIDSNRYPLIDSRVLIGWKKLQLLAGKEYSIASLGISSEVGKNQEHLHKLIDKYFYYRNFIVSWAKELDHLVERDLEFRLYLMGDRV